MKVSIHADCYNNYLCYLNVIFVEAELSMYWTGDTYYMDNTIPEDKAVSAVVNDMLEELAESDN